MFRRTTAAVAITAALAAGAAWAAQVTVTQKDKQFAVETIEVQAGDSVTFRNEDSVTHNVMSTSQGNAFDTGAVSPGTSSDVTFDNPGEVKVRCAIHPKMKMTVHVK